MTTRRVRVIAPVAALAMSVALLVPVASARSAPDFLPGQWDGGMWFKHEVRGGAAGEGTGSQHVGSGGFRLFGTRGDDGTTTTEGTLSFTVLVRGFSDIAESERQYDAEWQVTGSSSEIYVSGEVTARGLDSAYVQEEMPRVLGALLDDALLEGQFDIVEAIHAAACQWGWADLKRRSTVAP